MSNLFSGRMLPTFCNDEITAFFAKSYGDGMQFVQEITYSNAYANHQFCRLVKTLSSTFSKAGFA